MTRKEENAMTIGKMIELSESNPSGTYEEMVTFQLATIAAMLGDISKSLAILEDKAESETKVVKQGDYIERQAVLDIIMAYCQDDDGSVENTDDLRNALDDIESLPSVQPIRPKGEWEEYINRNDYNGYESEWYVCSKCQHIQLAATNFCSNCGADMKKVEE